MPGALSIQLGQRAAHTPEFVNPAFDLGEFVLGQSLYAGPVTRRLNEPKKLADLPQRETECLRPADETKSLHRVQMILPVTALGPRWLGQQPFAFIKADRLDADTRDPRRADRS